MADLARDGAPASSLLDSRNQIATLGALRQQLAGADVKTLAAMRADISAVVAASQATAQQARTSADTANAGTTANYAQNARAAVNDVMRGMTDFDADLHFASAQDKADYRRREEERRTTIAAEQAKDTPQGDLNATNTAIDQLHDAGAHGADQNPLFTQRLKELTKARDQLGAALASSATRETGKTSAPDPQRDPKTAPAAGDDLGAAMAALREAGVQSPTEASHDTPGETYKVADARTQTVTSGRV